jgi:hypothetical protein
MAEDRSGISDSARAEVNPTDTDDTPIEDLDPDWDDVEIARRQTEQPPPIPDRPADGATKAKWVDYCVALGADRTFLTSDTEHNDGTGTIVTEPALTRDELIELADRLGG